MPMDDAAIVALFLERYRADSASGGPRPLSAYQALFPGYEDLIAREIEDLAERSALRDQPPSQDHAFAGEGIARSGPGWIGPFRIVREIARGGQAEVYLAEDSRLHRTVALKVLRGLGTFSENVLRRFRREAEVTARLEHPGICPVHEAAVADGIAYIAMRYVAGKSLAQEVADARSATTAADTPDSSGERPSAAPREPITGRDTIRRTISLIRQTALALHAAHEAGVVHRDVKPG